MDLTWLPRSRHSVPVLAGLAALLLLVSVAGAVVYDSSSSPSTVATGTAQSADSESGGGDAAVAGEEGTGSLAEDVPATKSTGRAGSTRSTQTTEKPLTATGGGTTAGSTVKASGDPIKIGVLLLDIGNVTELGFPSAVSVEDQQKAWEHSTRKLNAAGGINGRPIQSIYKVYDPLSESSMREACLYLAGDKRVFFAVAPGGFIGPPVLCFTEEHKTPFLLAGSSGVPQEYYTRSKGLLFTTFMGSDRMIANFAEEVDRLGALKGKKIGVLHDLRSGPESIAEKMKRTLEDRGHAVGHVSIFSADYGIAGSQVPVEVNQHRSKGVEVIMNMSHALVFSQFTQEATSQQYVVPYFNSDWNGANSDFYYSNMPASYNGNLNFSIQRMNEHRAGLPEPAMDRQCADEAGEALGRRVPREDSNYQAHVRQCAFFILMRMGLTGAGTNLTAASLSSAMQQLGRLPLPNFGGMYFAPGRFDGGDHVRTVRWQSDCRCLIPVSGFRPTKF